MSKNTARILAFSIAFVLVVNIALLATKKINEILFWVIIIVAAVFAYKIIPKLKK